MQNHLLQVLALLTMERPVSMHPDDIRDEKTKLVRGFRSRAGWRCSRSCAAGAGPPGAAAMHSAGFWFSSRQECFLSPAALVRC